MPGSTQKDLEKKGVHVLSAGPDEVPGVYKDHEEVMREQSDLVAIVARFDPRIVKMCDDALHAIVTLVPANRASFPKPGVHKTPGFFR